MLLLGLSLAGCGGGQEDGPPATAAPADAGPPDAPAYRVRRVVLFLVDTLRADRLGAYGWPEPTSPHVDALAAEGVVFEQTSAAAPWTLPSVASLMLSTFLPEHGVVRDGDRVPAALPTLAERLKGLGWSTTSVFFNPYAGPLTGLDRGFDACLEAKREVGGEDVVAWLARQPALPAFLYLHNTTPHDPYVPAPRFLAPFGAVEPEVVREIEELLRRYRKLNRDNVLSLLQPEIPDNSDQQTEALQALAARRAEIETLYEAEVREADHHVGAAIEALRAAGAWEDTLFVLTSDHGEELGERGGFEHDQSVYEELLRVPLIVRFPGGAHAGTRVAAPVSLVDLVPTILDVLGRPDAAEGCRGTSLLPLVRGAAAPDGPRVTAFRLNRRKLYQPHEEARGDENVAVREGSWKGIWNVEHDTFELYDLARDPGETTDLAAREPERARRLRAHARESRDELLSAGSGHARERTDSLTPEQISRLRALGYFDEE